MVPTNTHLDAIEPGDNVWVKQGKTDHMATYIGDPRKVIVYDSDDSDSENAKEEYEVMIRWATTGTAAFVRGSSVRLVIVGQRRRRLGVNHYQAEPSQRPAGKKTKKKIEKSKPPKETEASKQEEYSTKKFKQTSVQKKIAPEKKTSSFNFKMPTREEFPKHREQKQKKKEMKKSKKEISRKRRRQNLIVTDDNNDKTNWNNDETNDSSVPAITSLTRRISDTDNDSDEKNRCTIAVQTVGKRKRTFQDASHTIDEGFMWEWETPETKSKAILKDNDKSSRLLPENFGKGPPRSWGEAFSMIVEHKQKTNQTNQCIIPSDDPLLGKFITEFRAEYSKYRRHAAEQRNVAEKTVYREFDRDSKKDLTRVDRKRLRQLKNIDFRWEINSIDQPCEDLLSLISEESEICKPWEIDSNDERMSVSSFDDDFERLVDDDSDECFSPGRATRRMATARKTRTKRKKPRSNISVTSFVSSSAPPNDDQGDDVIFMNCDNHDHAKDDKILIVPSLNHISLEAKVASNQELIRSGKPTVPIQLYRLLRLSATKPKSGLNKLIHWTDDGNSFIITDEAKFMEEVVEKQSKMKCIVSFRNLLGVLQFVMIDCGRDENDAVYRVFQHCSIQLAAEAKDPSLRLFFRGAPLQSLHKISTKYEDREFRKKEERKRQRKTKANAEALIDLKPSSCVKVDSKPSNREQERMSRRTIDGCLLPKGGSEHLLTESGKYAKPLGAVPKGLIWDEERGLWAPPHLLSTDQNVKIDSKPSNREQERMSRRTIDGCLLPKGGSEHLLTESGKYAKPLGAVPKGLIWDEDRGLWAPPHLLSTERKEVEPTLEKRRRIEKGQGRGQRTSARRTSDGCLMPKRQPFRFEDGTYKQPKGHQPKNLEWDQFRGLWVPADRSERLPGSESSFSGEDTTIIKASKAKLVHYQTFIFRAMFKPKKKIRKSGSMYQFQSFQARTKSNPTGVVNHSINIRNWQKIEELMKRETKRRKMAVSDQPVIPANTPGDDADVLV